MNSYKSSSLHYLQSHSQLSELHGQCHLDHPSNPQHIFPEQIQITIVYIFVFGFVNVNNKLAVRPTDV